MSAPCRIRSFYSRKEIVTVAAVTDARLHATFLETAVQSRRDIGRLVQASQEALCLHGRSCDRA
jgi:hypothetical protein